MKYCLKDDEEIGAVATARKRKRITNFGITFDSGYADGWTFGVPVAFRDALDILHIEYVDKDRSKELRQASGGKTRDSAGKLPTITERRWTRGLPPALSFCQGDIFYRPAHVRDLVWGEALPLLNHTIQVMAAQPDSDDGTGGGWVEFEMRRYEGGKVVSQSNHRVTQAEFEIILRTGICQS